MPSKPVFIRRLNKSDLTTDDDDGDCASSDDSSTTRKINRKQRDILRKVKAKEEKKKENTREILSTPRFFVSPFVSEGMRIYPNQDEESSISSISSCEDDGCSLCNDERIIEADECEDYILAVVFQPQL